MMRDFQRRRRAGLSILEVMFALSIAVFGLLGIALLLPMAGRNSSDSARMAESQALAHQWYDDLLVTGAANSTNWVHFRDFNNGTNPAFEAYTSLGTRLNGYSTNTRFTNRQAICVDPFFMSSDNVANQLAAGSWNQTGAAPPAAHRWYRPAVFPYYVDTYNPVVDPAYTYGAQSSFALTDQPRMVRVTLGTPTLRISHRAAHDLLGSQDDLAITLDDSDKTVPPMRVAPSPTKMTSKHEYSWIATIVPNDTLVADVPVSSALLSVAVIHKRNRLFYDVTNAASIPTRAPGFPEPENKPNGELFFRVVPQYYRGSGGSLTASSFVGGHGGTVTLVATDGVPDRIRAGEWVLLSKNRIVSGVASSVPVFRWYRIAAVEGEPLYVAPANIADLDPASSAGSAPDQVWGRRVVLDGPDWVFDPPGLATSQPTHATYIPGTVAVYERMIPW